MVNASNAPEYVALATMQGAVVALPHPAAFERLGHLRSPAWALVAPGSLLLGTFGVLALPLLASALAVLAQIATPVLATIAVMAVVHGRQRGLLLVPLVLGVVAATGAGWPGELAASLLTALGCLTLGTAFARVTPARWLYLGVLSMVGVDVLLLALGVGQPADALLREAMGSTIGPAFDRAQLGDFSLDYPDLVLAAVVGAMIADRAIQRSAALLVAVSAAAYGALFAFADMLPATVPLALVLVLVAGGRAAVRRPGRWRPGRYRPPCSWPLR